jgi:hypothetical protein
MPEEIAIKMAEPVTVSHSMRNVAGLEWRTATSGAPLVIAAPELSAESLAPFAERAMARFRVIGIKAVTPWDPITTCWWAGEPVILLAQGAAGKLACQSALTAPGAVKALILADYAPAKGDTAHRGIIVPTLVFHGRQSGAETHAQAVRLHEEIPGSHLIEPEDCGAEPTRTCAEPLAQSLEWFLGELGAAPMLFGDGPEPVDPRG